MAEDNNDQNVVQPQNNAQQAVPTQPADVATDNAATSGLCIRCRRKHRGFRRLVYGRPVDCRRFRAIAVSSGAGIRRLRNGAAAADERNECRAAAVWSACTQCADIADAAAEQSQSLLR